MIHRDRRAIILWLSLCLLLVAAMVLVGGYTRLSGSGLSITQWKPVHGVLPPLDEMQWQEEFSAYRATPQYALVNKGMSLAEFKTIFWPEFFHRLLARTVGIVFFIPLLVFAMRRAISKRFFWRLAGIFALGGLQGAVGWVMVASGLVDTPYVSPVKLAMHLGLAFAIFGLIEWQLLVALSSPSPLAGEGRDGEELSAGLSTLREPPLPTFPLKGGRLYRVWFSALACQIILGALLAGLHGGLVYNTWPDMNGQFAPSGLFSDNITLIQFAHRTLAIFVACGFLFWWYSQREYVKNRHLGRVCSGVTLVLFMQFSLGVLTLVNAATLPLALTHQITALLLWASAVLLMYKLKNT